MIWFKEHIIFYLVIFSVNCGRWYSATTEDHNLFDDNDSKYTLIKYLFSDIPKNKNKEMLHKKRPFLSVKQFLQTSANIDAINNYNTSNITYKNSQWQKSLENPPESIEQFHLLKNDCLNNKTKMTTQRKILGNRRPTIAETLKQLPSNGTPKSRYLEVFQVVEFDHVSCTSSSGLEGACLPEYKCNADGGSVMGTCADGYGVCCVSLYTCEDSTAVTMSWFTNADFPSPSVSRLSCTLTLHKASDDIRQIRLDFLDFEILPPTAGRCQEDQFVISGQNINSIVPILCGMNSGQHVYLEVSDVDGPIHFSMQTVTSETRLFSIKVSQLTSTDDLAAPTGCLQYYTDSEGFLKSFNYGDTSDFTSSSYTNNLNYAMCIQRAVESCSVTYTVAGDMQIVNYDTDGLPVIPPNQAGVEIYNCPSDYLLISATRLCGERLNDGSVLQDFSKNAPITDISAGPIVIWFRSDEAYAGRGFKLKYQQNGCNAPE